MTYGQYKEKELIVIDRVITKKQNNKEDSIEMSLFIPPPKEEWVNRALLHMGYPDLTAINPDISAQTHDICERVGEVAAPGYIFKSDVITNMDKKTFSTSHLMIRSKNWAAIAAEASAPTQVCCFGLTLGHDIEREIASFEKRSLVQGYIWDALCSTLAEYYADQAEQFIGDHYAQQNFLISRRFSPGYCDLPFEESQRAVFSFCDMTAIGVTRVSSGLMVPRKSVTAMVLASESLPVPFPCSFCRTPCRYRRSASDERVKRQGSRCRVIPGKVGIHARVS